MNYWRELTCLALLVCSAASAAPVEFEFSGVADGTFGSQGFFGTAFTLTLTGDTDDIEPVSSPADVLKIDLAAGVVMVEGVVTSGLSDAMTVFANRSNESVGLRDAVQRADWIAVTLAGSGLNTYALDTSLSVGPDLTPFVEPGEFSLLSVPLEAGALRFANLDSLAFTATVVPLPPAVALFAAALVAGLPWLRRTSGRKLMS